MTCISIYSNQGHRGVIWHIYIYISILLIFTLRYLSSKKKSSSYSLVAIHNREVMLSSKEDNSPFKNEERLRRILHKAQYREMSALRKNT